MPLLMNPIRVQVADDGKPHAGRRGWLTETLTLFGPPRGMIRLSDGGQHDGNTIVVSLGRVEPEEMVTY